MNASNLWQALGWIEAGSCLRLTQALAHFLWQGCAVAIVYAVAARLLFRASANARYLAGVAALLVMALCLPVTFLVLSPPRIAAVDTTEHLGTVLTPGTTAPMAVETVAGPAALGPASYNQPTDAAVSSSAIAPPRGVSGGGSLWQSTTDRVATMTTWASPYISSAYLCGFVLMLLRVAFGSWGGERLRSAGTPVSDGAILEMIGRHARRLGMRVIPVVAYCRRVSVPVVVGALRPMVLLPASLASCLTLGQLEAVLVHELAHIRRFDPAANVLQRLIEAMLFFHPAVWWVSRRIRVERENACDDLVLRSHCGRTVYADALVRMAELCTATGHRDLLERATLAATGKNASQFKRRVLRLLDQDDEPAIRLSSAGVVISMMLILSVFLAPVAWRGAARAGEEPKGAQAMEPNRSTERETPDRAGQQAKPENLLPVSMTADQFGRLPVAEQRALLVRVFQRRLEHSKDLYYEADQLWRSYENRDGKPGRLLAEPSGFRTTYRHWRLGDSFRMELDGYKNPGDAEWSSHSSYGVNAEEGVGRNTMVSKDPKRPPSGQVQYPFDPTDSTAYVHWLDGKHSIDLLYAGPHGEDYLFRYLVDHQAEFEITAPVAGGKVQLTFDWKPEWAEKAGGKRVYLLDSQKGFLPIRCDSRYDDPPTKARRMWRIENFVVEDSRLVGDVWMPTKLMEETAASSVPNRFSVLEIKVLRIERGMVRPADLMVPFTEGMQIVDTIVGVMYVADAQGRPAGPVKVAPGWRNKPPETWPQRRPAAESKPGRSSTRPGPSAGEKGTIAFSMASRLSAADREMLQAEERMKQERWKPIDAALKVLQSKPPVPQDERIEAALEILRIYRISEKEAAWASAIRELILIGKRVVPKLIEELDRTERDETLRALGFVLRGIGDPRAVPAMVRAIPRLLQPPRSDSGLMIENDPELLKFMQQHDTDGKVGSPWFGYCRAIREIMIALQKITGETHGWMELNFTHLAEGADQQRVQRRLFLNLAERWADWWSKNWQRYLKDESDAQLDLIRRSLDACSKAIAAAPKRPPRTEFPCGSNVTVGEGSIDVFIRSFDESPSSGFLDFDSGRHPTPPEELVKKSAGPEPSKELLAWAEREGVDLINVKVTPPASEKTFYAFKPLGMKVWRIENSRFDNLQQELRESKTLILPAPWGGPLAQIDEKSGRYDDKLTVSFLFITKEGTCGAIQIQSPVTRKLVPGTYTSAEGGLHYKFIYESSPAKQRT